MSFNLSHPPFWLVLGLEWQTPTNGPHAECAYAIAPLLIPKGILSPAAYTIFELAKAVAPDGGQQVVMFSELSETLRKHNGDWPTIGVPDWEATVYELTGAPVPGLFLSLSQYAHLMLCTAGMENTYTYEPGGQQRRIPESDREDLRNSLRTMLMNDWPDYIQDLHRSGKIRSSP